MDSEFDLIVDLPESLLPTFTRAAAFADTHIKRQPLDSQVCAPSNKLAGECFMWSDFRTDIMTRPGTDIAFNRLQSTTIHASEGASDPEADLARKVMAFISDSFPVVAREQLGERIEIAFGDPTENESQGVITLMKSYDGEGLGQDRVGVPLDLRVHQRRPGRLLLRVRHDSEVRSLSPLCALFLWLAWGWLRRYTDEAIKKSGILGMGGSTKHSYSADVVAMQVAVEKGFTADV